MDGSRRLTEASSMGGFAAVALAAAEGILDFVNKRDDTQHTVLALEGAVHHASASAQSHGEQHIKVFYNVTSKTRVVDAWDSRGRQVTEYVGCESSSMKPYMYSVCTEYNSVQISHHPHFHSHCSRFTYRFTSLQHVYRERICLRLRMPEPG